MQLLTKEGTSGFAEGLRLLVNEAMLAERTAVLGARPYERSETRLGHANGFKPKTLATRLGATQVPCSASEGRGGLLPQLSGEGRA